MGGITWLGLDEFNTLSTLNVKVNLSSWPPYEGVLYLKYAGTMEKSIDKQ